MTVFSPDEACRPVVGLAMAPRVHDRLLHAEHYTRLEAVAELPCRRPIGSLADDAADELLARVEVLLTSWGCPVLDEPFLDRAPNLALVAHAAGTVKPFVTPALWARGVQVTSAAAANAIPVAEFTVAAIVLAAKDVFRLRDTYRAGRGEGMTPGFTPTRGLHRRRVGIVGASRVGRRVIELLRPYNIEVWVHDPYLDAAGAASLGVRATELSELLRSCDIVSLHAPLLAETRGLLGPEELALLRAGAWLINTARGALVDTAALEAHCASGRIAAVLDTTEPEPLPADSVLWELTNVIITPHLAGAQGEELARLADAAITEIERFSAGEPPLEPVTEADLEQIA